MELVLVLLQVAALSHFATEDFVYSGAHAAYGHGGEMATVWWDVQKWDARQDTTWLSQSWASGGHHIDIHKAASSDPTNGALSMASNVKNGDGSDGIGVMHVDYHGSVSARLRNPVLISAENTLEISFFASRAVTTAHWWELILTPKIIGAENTAIPSVERPLPAPLARDGLPNGGATAGPGRTPYQDSINIIYAGRDDLPCRNGHNARLALSIASEGRGLAQYYIDSQKIIAGINPDELALFKFTIRPTMIVARIDFDNDTNWDIVKIFNLEKPLPWTEMYVHLAAVAYQADHHPQGTCQVWPKVRELKWRNFKASPTKYASVKFWPQEFVGAQELKTRGWLDFDLRDTQRRGVVLGTKQPNDDIYRSGPHHLMCAPASRAWNCDGVRERTWQFEVDDHFLAKSNLIYDAKGLGGIEAYVNGQMIYPPPRASSVSNAADAWVHLNQDIPLPLLRDGANELKVKLLGNCEIDRIGIETFFD